MQPYLRATFSSWVALFLAILMGVMAFCGSAAMTCQAQKACLRVDFVGEKVCLTIPDRCDLASCHLKNLLLLPKFQVQADPPRTHDPMQSGPAAMIDFPPVKERGGRLFRFWQAAIPRAPSPPLFLLKSSFIC